MADTSDQAEMLYRLHRGTAPDISQIPHWDDLDAMTREALRFCVALAALSGPPALEPSPTMRIEVDGWKFVPVEPTVEMWRGLARDIVMWTHFNHHSGLSLHDHLKANGRAVPDWLVKEIPPTDQTPPKGTVAACIYKAMIDAAPNPQPQGKNNG